MTCCEILAPSTSVPVLSFFSFILCVCLPSAAVDACACLHISTSSFQHCFSCRLIFVTWSPFLFSSRLLFCFPWFLFTCLVFSAFFFGLTPAGCCCASHRLSSSSLLFSSLLFFNSFLLFFSFFSLLLPSVIVSFDDERLSFSAQANGVFMHWIESKKCQKVI